LRLATFAFALSLASAFAARLHLDQQLAAPALGAHADVGRLFDQGFVLGLLGVGLERDGAVADALDLVDAVRLGEPLAGALVESEPGVAVDDGGQRGRASGS
jgi:hypothetical protein